MSLSIDHILTRAVVQLAADPTAPDPGILDAAVLDPLVEALMISGDASERAQVICAVLEEMFSAVTWLQTQGAGPMESASLRLVLNAAYDHSCRVSVSRVGPPAATASESDHR